MCKIIKQMRLRKAIKILKKELETDKEYRAGWEANIATSFRDSTYWYVKESNKRYMNNKDKSEIATRAAKLFISNLIGND